MRFRENAPSDVIGFVASNISIKLMLILHNPRTVFRFISKEINFMEVFFK